MMLLIVFSFFSLNLFMINCTVTFKGKRKFQSNNKSKVKDKRINREWIDHDPIRTRLTNEILHEIHGISIIPHQDLFSSIANIIGTFDFIDPLWDIQNNVMRGLKLSLDEWKELNFYSENFVNQLGLILVSSSNSKKNDLRLWMNENFCHDLSSLVFKWMIHMKQRIAIDNEISLDSSSISPPFKNDRFKNILKSIQEISLIIYKMGNLKISLNFNLESMNSSELKKFKLLIKSEFYENPHLFPIFTLAIQDFYDLETGGKKMTCHQFKSKYFGGNYEKNILLEYLIFMYDPRGEMRKCIMRDDSQMKFLNVFEFEEDLDSIYFYDLKLKGPKNLEIADPRYASRFIINFFLSSNRRIPIDTFYDLIRLLRRLKESELLEEETIKKIVGFESFGLLEWDREKFREYINRYKKYFEANQERIDECNKYLKLIK